MAHLDWTIGKASLFIQGISFTKEVQCAVKNKSSTADERKQKNKESSLMSRLETASSDTQFDLKSAKGTAHAKNYTKEYNSLLITSTM